MRVYDPRIGKFLSTDPLSKQYPHYTPYQFAGNTPIQAIDLDGAEEYHFTYIKGKDGRPAIRYLGKNDIVDRVVVGYRSGHGIYNDAPVPVYENRVNQRQLFTVHDIYREPIDRHGGLDPNQSQEWKDFDVRTTYKSFEDFSAGKNGSRSLADMAGITAAKFSAAMGPENAALPAGGLGNLRRRSTTVSFYTVQDSEDASRLLSGGNPWPTAPTRAQWGEGLYAWGSKAEAQAYLDTYLKRGITDMSIVEFKIDGAKLGKLSQHTVIGGTEEATLFFDKYSRIYGEGLPHGFDYIKAPTSNFGSEHFFSKGVFHLFKGSK